jgi:hypothetical protein
VDQSELLANAEPGADLVTPHEFAHVGSSGNACDRVAVVMASARTVPTLMYSREVGKSSNMTCTSRNQIG